MNFPLYWLSRKRTPVLTGTFFNSTFYLPVKLCIYTFPHSFRKMSLLGGGPEKKERQRRVVTSLKRLFQVQLLFFPLTFSTLCSKVILTKHSFGVRRLYFFFCFLIFSEATLFLHLLQFTWACRKLLTKEYEGLDNRFCWKHLTAMYSFWSIYTFIFFLKYNFPFCQRAHFALLGLTGLRDSRVRGMVLFAFVITLLT